jgi:hypothetical protein
MVLERYFVWGWSWWVWRLLGLILFLVFEVVVFDGFELGCKGRGWGFIYPKGGIESPTHSLVIPSLSCVINDLVDLPRGGIHLLTTSTRQRAGVLVATRIISTKEYGAHVPVIHKRLHKR